MKYKTLGFTLFRKCNANCDICCFESSPSCKERLDKELIKKYIDSAVRDENLQNISFTGGEPFLEYNLLLELIEYATEKGFNANLITNGFWANTKEIAIERLTALKKKGLKRMNVSFDEFHNEYINEKNVGVKKVYDLLFLAIIYVSIVTLTVQWILWMARVFF